MATAAVDLPWLQDVVGQDVESRWGAAYRDVVILDAWNRPIDPPFNLTVNDLSREKNRDLLKQRLREAAVFVDTDGDGLGDDWEDRFLGGLDHGALDDPDGDGETALLEFALGTPPLAGRRSGPDIAAKSAEGSPEVFLSYRRRLGLAGGLQYVLERKEDDHGWVPADDDFRLVAVTNPYDGTGTEVVFRRTRPGAPSSGLLRLRVTIDGKN